MSTDPGASSGGSPPTLGGDPPVDERVVALQRALGHAAGAATSAAVGLWLLAMAIVFLATQLASRAQDVGEAQDLGEAVALDATALTVAKVLALLAAIAAVVLLARWVRAAAGVLPLVGEDAPARGAGALAVLWRAGGEAPRPRTLDLFAVLLPTGLVAAFALSVIPRTYDTTQALDLLAVLACVVVLAAVLLGIGVLRRVSDRHVGRAKYVTGVS